MRNPHCSRFGIDRRHALGLLSGSIALPFVSRAAEAPAAPVAIARCMDYGAELTPVLRRMFDQLGGLARIVRGKTVGIKVNLTGGPRERMGYVPAELAQYTHPAVIGTVVRLIGEAGASRVRILEGAFACSDPLEEFMLEIGWDPMPLLNAGARVDMENTNILGKGKKYHRLMTPRGGYIFNGFDFNHSYAECGVLVSLAKMKEHATAGITGALKNCFGCTPITIYGDGAGKDEPSVEGRGGRGAIMHSGVRQPPKSALPENDPKSPRQDTWRIPRIVADIAAALPIHLSIIDGIQTMAGGEGPWVHGTRPVRPGLLIAGLNPVCNDAVMTALMGFDPMADRGTPPFERCDSTLKLAEHHGVGTRDLRRIEVIGGRIQDWKMRFRGA